MKRPAKTADQIAKELCEVLTPTEAFRVAQGRERWAKKDERKEFWGLVQVEIARLSLADKEARHE